jgi:N-acetylglucosamine-6-phosphate deacetylase
MRLSRREAVAMATINPARFLKIADRKGSLEAGKDADCVVLDEGFNVVETVIAGVRLPKITYEPRITNH